jgi:hypothetical protein
MVSPHRSRPQLARINTPRDIPTTLTRTKAPATPPTVELGADFASQTSFCIRGGRGAADVTDIFHKLGLSGLEHFTIPDRLRCCHGSHPQLLPPPRHSLDLGGGAEVSMPLELPKNFES